MPSLRATPTKAIATSFPEAVISKAADLPGSVSDPWARNAPRQTACASPIEPATSVAGNPLAGRPLESTNPVCLARISPWPRTLT